MIKKLKTKEIISAVAGLISAALCFYSGVKTTLKVIENIKSEKKKEK